MPASRKIKGEHFGQWEVLTEAQNNYCFCRCSCGRTRWVLKYSLTSGKSTSCGICKIVANNLDDITGEQFNEWKVIEYKGKGKWLCECSCGKEQIVEGKTLKNGTSKSCGHDKLIDLTSKQFGEWTVLKYRGNGKWLCRCSCGKEKEVDGGSLRSGASTSCGCDSNKFIDLTGQQFGEWEVLRYIGNQMWECRCSCNTIKNVSSQSLRLHKSNSCGCKTSQLLKTTMFDRYGDINTSRISKPREKWQIEALQDRENLLSIINEFDSKPSIYELAEKLDITHISALRAIHKYNLEEQTALHESTSKSEKEIYNLIKQLVPDKEVISRAKILNNNRELDIYIPELKLAIEFNGVFWHSDIFKTKLYHQEKTIECAKRGIRLIHIFEYEWENKDTKEKIINILKSALNINSDILKIYGRNIEVREEPTSTELTKFIGDNHIQNDVPAQIRIVARYNSDIVGELTFGKPRFDSECEWELLRLIWKKGIRVTGGTERLFKYFINKHHPNSILTYCDISKFTGNVYTRLGFTCNYKDITDPNYVWVKVYKNNGDIKYDVLSRYKTMKSRLIEQGLQDYGDTETEIMRNLGYIRVYDSGNLRLTWRTKVKK